MKTSESRKKRKAWRIRLLVALRRTIDQPTLISELITKILWRSLDRFHIARVEEYQQYIQSTQQVICKVLDSDQSKWEEVLSEAEFLNEIEESKARASELGINWQGGGADMHLLYGLCRLLQPKVVLETGVQDGWSSLMILLALEKNGSGHLHSIDLPAFHPKAYQSTGIMVSERLKHRWTLHLGPQRKILPNLLSVLPEVDLLHYDSDKTYRGMYQTYSKVWPKLTSGGILVSDDLNNNAFLDFSEKQSVYPNVMYKNIKGRVLEVSTNCMGLIVHP